MPLIPQFSQGDIDNEIDNFVLNKEQKIIWALGMVGEEFVNAARSLRTYKDQTGDLRSSIGYIIAQDGKILIGKFEGKTEEGREQGRKVANEVLRLRENSKGFVLIGVAGMEYAAAVESKGKDVITGSIPAAKALLRSKIKEYSI